MISIQLNSADEVRRERKERSISFYVFVIDILFVFIIYVFVINAKLSDPHNLVFIIFVFHFFILGQCVRRRRFLFLIIWYLGIFFCFV